MFKNDYFAELQELKEQRDDLNQEYQLKVAAFKKNQMIKNKGNNVDQQIDDFKL